MNKNKKAQAAMEFLMTYGWAILVVLIAISALAYFGVLNPSRFLPESCTLVPGMSCIDFKADGATNTTTIVIQNGMGQDLNVFKINMSGYSCIINDTLGTFNDADKQTFTMGCTGLWDKSGQRLKEDIIISFNSTAGITHTETGQLITKIE
ncbi:hypothetical protein ISS04_01910 [Candidatus Woesearchaeota archaeon]|nr:hypothetical protein [Candidatus Woesearchaeota archaeon]